MTSSRTDQHPGAIAEALAAFASDDHARAIDIIRRLTRAGPLSADGRDLLDLLLPPLAEPDLVSTVIEFNEESMTPFERARWLARRFDALAATGDQGTREAALDLLASATLAGSAGWALVQEPKRRTAIDTVLSDPQDRIETLEQEMVAPVDTGLPDRAIGKALVLGREMVLARRSDGVRDVERILHALGEPALAYSLEAERKRLEPARSRRAPTPSASTYAGPRLEVLVAGGHPTLRAMIRSDLGRLELADIREFPSAWEGSRVGRHARDSLTGADLAVIIRRQIAHSTSDQVATAAKALAIPVVRAETPTISAVRRAVETFATTRASGSVVTD